MGQFINGGIAIGFAFGVTTALLARRYPVTRKHPNLLGFAVAGTVDAISRDYRRPFVYSKLVKLNTPLGLKSQSILLSLRTGAVESDLHFAQSVPSNIPEAKESTLSTEVPTSGWWDEDTSISESSQRPETGSAPGYQYEVVKVPSPSLTNGSRTWEDIRRQNQSKDSSV